MPFLPIYESIPAEDVRSRVGFVYQSLRSDWRGMFAELRAQRPVFANPAFTMATRHGDVIDILSQPELFSVRGYAAKMDPSVGPFMLARDKTEINWNDKGVMRSVLRFEDLPRVRAMAGEAARASIDAAGDTVDLVPAVGRLVPLRIVQNYFGFKGPDDPTMLRWSKATQTDMFRNPFNNPEQHQACIAAGNEMRAWIRGAIQRPRPAPEPGPPPRPNAIERLLRMLFPRAAEPPAQSSAPPADPGPQGEDAFARLQRMMRSADAPFEDEERIVSNVAGLLVGAIETSSQAIVQAAEQIMMRPDVRAEAEAAAAAGDNARFDAIVWEALRFNPITGMVFRFTERDTTLAPGTPHATPVKKGTVVAACIGSAMFDETAVAEADAFRAGRPDATLFHLGFGHHECLGKHVGMQIVPEAVRQILLTPGLRRIDGAEGQIDFAGGVFPEHFRVTRTAPAEPVQPAAVPAG
jgi:cytochrome P450